MPVYMVGRKARKTSMLKAERNKFSEVYHSLPQDAQQALVENHLISLVGRTSIERAKRANAAASKLHKRHQGLPVLDLKAKKAEINFLLEELAKDSKRSLVMDISNSSEFQNELVNSLTDWYNDLWSVAYEHNVQHELVHESLLLIHDAISRLGNVRSCCQCSLKSLYAPVVIKSKTGAVIKSFPIQGVQNLEIVSEFIWRDLFLSMLAGGKEDRDAQVAEMLAEIQQAIGWSQLVRILRGKKDTYNMDGDDEDDWSDVDNDDDAAEDLLDITWEEVAFGKARHWPTRISSQLPRLRKLVEETMKKQFEVTPSGLLYRALLEISFDHERVASELMSSIEDVARVSSDTYAVALEIYSFEFKVPPILNLLRTHGHLLRPRDATALQAAVLVLDRANHTEMAITYVRRELAETARAILKALTLSFSRLDEPANKTELAQILKMRHNTAARRNRIETWVDAITTPGANAANPIMLAAMMMGVPPMPGMSSDDDAYTYLDLDPLDPDLEDLRHEYRPALKKRFESWVNVAHMLKPGPATLLSVYRFLIDLMPFLRATEITEEIIGRLQDRPSKQFVCDGVDALLAFSKIQKRKWREISAEIQKKKEMEAQNQAQAASSSSPSPLGGTSPSGSNDASPSPAQDGQGADASASAATPISGPVPVKTMLSAFQHGSSSTGEPSTSVDNTDNPTEEDSSRSDPVTLPGAANGGEQPSGLVQSFLTNPLAPSVSAQGLAGLSLPLAAIFGGFASPVPGPSLDDVD